MVDFDIDSYAALYSGNAKINRLLFVASHTEDPLATRAKALALAEAREGTNLVLVDKITKAAKIPDGDAWKEATEAKGKKLVDSLDGEWSNQKSSLNTDKSRTAGIELAHQFFKNGDTAQALSTLHKVVKDYGSSSPALVGVFTDIALYHWEAESMPSVVSNYASRAEKKLQEISQASKEDTVDPVARSKIKVLQGLSAIKSRNWEAAASSFIDCDAALGDSFNHVLTTADVGVYGALLGLAAFSRQGAKAKIMDNGRFMSKLDHSPRLKEVVEDYCLGNYSRCLRSLQELRPTLIDLDYCLRELGAAIVERIRNSALVSYIHPYLTIDLHRAAEVFDTTAEGIEQEMVALIMRKTVSAFIDSKNKVMYARRVNIRDVTFETVLKLGSNYLRESKAVLLRLSLIKHDFSVTETGGGGSSWPRGMEGILASDEFMRAGLAGDDDLRF